MAGSIRTVDSLVQEVRSLMDEDNNSSLRTTEDILPSLTRGQEVASNILSRHYESPLLTHTNLQPVASGAAGGVYQIPEDAFEERLEKVELIVGNTYQPLLRLSYRDLSQYETSSPTIRPTHYCVIGQHFRLVPQTPTGLPLRVWYLRTPRPLVLPQGTITYVHPTLEYFTLDNQGSSLSSETDNLNSYISVFDGNTGWYKASFQIQSIQDGKLTIRPTPLRTTVLNQTISGTLYDLTDEQGLPVSIQPDDLISTIHGSPVSFFRAPFSNYIVQYAVSECSRKLGLPADGVDIVKKELEQLVERSWVGREQSLRVSHRNAKWNPTLRQWNRRPSP